MVRNQSEVGIGSDDTGRGCRRAGLVLILGCYEGGMMRVE